jgi:predicted transcriptional regulator
MSKKLNAVVRDEVIEALDDLAKEENRTRSQMSDILLGEAIAARQKIKSEQSKTSSDGK